MCMHVKAEPVICNIDTQAKRQVSWMDTGDLSRVVSAVHLANLSMSTISKNY